jgi:hypothetical protein
MAKMHDKEGEGYSTEHLYHLEREINEAIRDQIKTLVGDRIQISRKLTGG